MVLDAHQSTVCFLSTAYDHLIQPFLIDSDGNLRDNPYSWTRNANVIFLDQPAGTGYSVANPNVSVNNTMSAAAHVLNFIDKFVTIFPEYHSPDVLLGLFSYILLVNRMRECSFLTLQKQSWIAIMIQTAIMLK